MNFFKSYRKEYEDLLQRAETFEAQLRQAAEHAGLKEEELKKVQQQKAYADGQVETLREHISTLQGQLREWMRRAGDAEQQLVRNLSIGAETFSEEIRSAYEEDEDELKQLHKGFSDEGDL